MSEANQETPIAVLPTLSTGEKLAIREQQYKILAAEKAHRELAQKSQTDFASLIVAVLSKYGLDPAQFGLNDDTLEVQAIQRQ